MSASWKTVRVFISSTFRDMHAERDWLVKRVFPALRERLGQYRIHLVDIDLRWGITEEESQHDRVLDLCLQQIDDCRPFFVGILGERYGWVPSSFSEAAASKYGWVQHHTGKSVTELEILYGVLNDIQMRSRAFFFFRDPSFIPELDAQHRQVFCEGPTEEELQQFSPEEAEVRAEDRRRKLDDLKGRIRQSVCPVMDGYPARWDPQALDRPTKTSGRLVGLEEFGRRVQEELWRAIQSQEGLPDVPPVETLAERDPLAEEAAYHDQFMESRLRVYVGREKIQRDLIGFADGDATSPCLVTGPSGSGKSAAMARFVRSYIDSHPDALVIPHFVGASPGSTSLRQMLRRFCLILQQRFGPAEEVPQDVNGLVSRFRTSLESVPADARVVLLIDALNQLDETDNAHSLYWLPWHFPPQVKVVVSCIDDTPEKGTGSERSEVPVPFSTTEPVLKALALRPHEAIRIEPLTDNERFEIVSQVPSMSAKKLSPKQIGLLLSNPATENPLFLLVALEELRGFGSFEQLEARIAALPRPSSTGILPVPRRPGAPGVPPVLEAGSTGILPVPGGSGATGASPVLEDGTGRMPVLLSDPVTAIFDQVIERLREDFDADEVRTVLALLACSRGGMSERELVEMVEGDCPSIRLNENGTVPFAASEEKGTGSERSEVPVPFSGRESTSNVYPVLRQLRPYLQHRGELLDFFHRGLYKAVRQRYLPAPDDAISYHRDLADYFHRKLNPPGAAPWSGQYTRSFSELPHHQTQGRLWEDLETTLTTLPFLEGKVQAGMPFELVGDFSAAVASLPEDRQQRKILRLLDEALRRDIHFIARHATDYPQGLFQCLWNTCWWYDCDEAGQHYESGSPPGLPSPASGRGAGGEGTSPPLPPGKQRNDQSPLRAPTEGWSGEGQGEGSSLPSPASGRGARGEGGSHRADHRLCNLLEHWRQAKQQSSPGFSWLRSHRPPPVHLGTAQKAVLRGHEKPVTSVTYSPDGRWIASGSSDNTVRVWDATTGAELAVLRGHEHLVMNVSYSPDGARIASGLWDHTVRVWDARSGAELVVLRGHTHPVTSVSYSPDGARIASGSWDKTVRVWDAESGAELAVLRGHKDDLTSVSYSPDGARIASGSADKTVRVWDATSGAELVVLRGHESGVESVSYSPDGTRIASGSGDKTVRLWDATSGAELAALRGHESGVESVSYSPDGAQIASGSYDGTVRVWDATSGAELAVLRGHENIVDSVAYSPDGAQIASGSYDGTVRVWDATSGAELAVLHGHENHAPIVSYSPDGARIASGGRGFGKDYTVRVWDANSGAELAVLHGHEHQVMSVSYTPDSARITSGSGDKTVRVWDANSGAELAVLRGHHGRVESVSYSPDGTRIASGSDDTTVRVWDVQSGAEMAVLRGHEDNVTSVSYSPDGTRIASGSGDKTVRVWDANSGAELAVLRGHHGRVESVSYSPDGTRIASGSYDGTVRVWDATSGAELAVLRGHESNVNRVSFSPDGARMASGGDNTVRVWDVISGECLEVIRGSGDVRAIASGSRVFPWRALERGPETAIERADNGETVAWFPVALSEIVTHPSARAWAGAVGNYLCLITLEGDGILRAGDKP